MLNSRTVGGAVLGLALCGMPLTLQSTTDGSSRTTIAISAANATELSVPQTTYRRKAKRYTVARASRLYDLYCGGPYIGGGYNGGTYYGGPWIDLRCFDRAF